MLDIKNLHAGIDGKEILKGINLTVRPGEVHAIMGPNGSGKSTLSAVLTGNPAYKVTEGEVTFYGKNLLEMSPEDRSHEGIFLSFQYPVEIPGVSMVNFMRAALNAKRKYYNQEPLSASDFLKLMREKRAIVQLDNKLASRSVNEGFSGGEKKRNEIFQMAVLEPRLSILDETDSGLDIDALRIVAEGVNKLKTDNNATIVITHYQRLLDYIKPDVVHVLYKGRIVKTAGPELALELEDDQYIELYKENGQAVCRNSAGALNEARREALASLAGASMPRKGDEDYEVTSLEDVFAPDYGVNVNRVELGANPAEAFRCDVPNMSTCMYFLFNDAFHPGKNAANSLPEGVVVKSLKDAAVENAALVEKYYNKAADGKCVQTALNTLLAQDGIFVYVPKGVVVEKPIQLVNILNSGAPLMANRRMLIVLEEGAQARMLVCDHTQNCGVGYLDSQVVEIFAGERVVFDYYDIEDSSTGTNRVASFYVHQAAGSNLMIDGITLMNGFTRNNYTVEMEGEGAELHLYGMAMANGNRHIDNHTVVRHTAKGGHTDELFKYVLDDNAVGAFSGLVQVCPGAEKTEAYQSNKNICASDGARMYSKPQLLIDCDDVKCSHGSSTGQLDQQALFYMRQRGIPEHEARLMLMQAFMHDVIAGVRMEALKDRLRHLVENRFLGNSSSCRTCPSTCHKSGGKDA